MSGEIDPQVSRWFIQVQFEDTLERNEIVVWGQEGTVEVNDGEREENGVMVFDQQEGTVFFSLTGIYVEKDGLWFQMANRTVVGFWPYDGELEPEVVINLN